MLKPLRGRLLARPLVRPLVRPLARPLVRPLARIANRRAMANDAGMSTAEYAVGTIAAVAFAAVLYKVVQSDAVRAALTSIVQSALNVSL